MRVSYVKSTEFGQVIAIVWVDDIIFVGSNTDVKKKAKVSYDEIQNERPWCFIKVPRYPIQVWKRLYWNEPKQVCWKDSGKVQHVWLQAKRSPMRAGCKQSQCSQWKWIYLIYLMTWTRPDLCYVVIYLSQRLSKPMKSHYGMARQLLRYLKGTHNRRLKFVKRTQLKLVGYSDSY